MTDEPRTVADFVEALIAERGGRACFSAVQVRICHTVALALRDPSKVDPSVVSRLIDLLPPRVVPPEAQPQVEPVVFLDAFDCKLEALLQAYAPDLLRDTVMTELATRVADLENENTALHLCVTQLRNDLAHARVEAVSDTFSPDSRTSGHGNGSGRHASGNVVRLSRVRDETHSLAMNSTIDDRYPRGLEPA
jgi:hypothetical protein